MAGEVKREQDRRVQIDSRGAGLITISSALLTLAFAASALVTKSEGFVLSRVSLWSLAFAFVAFMTAAFCGLLAVGLVDEDRWRTDEDRVTRLLTQAMTVHLQGVRESTNRRAAWITVGSRAQLLALGGLLVAVGTILAKAIDPSLVGWSGMFLPPARA